MIEGIILGTIQGIAEWLPISSEALLILVKSRFFGSEESFIELIEFSMFLHLGTFLAALWYLRDDVFALIKIILAPQRIFRGEGEVAHMFRFLSIATLISGGLGYALVELALPFIEQYTATSARVITMGIGVLLLGTAFVQWQAKRKRTAHKNTQNLDGNDALLLGIVQGLSALPGLSRSGLTISALLLRNYDDTTALRMSFLMSLPVVLGANVFLAFRDGISLGVPFMLGFFFSFLFGFFSIRVLFRLAQKLNFAYFVFAFGILTIISALFP